MIFLIHYLNKNLKNRTVIEHVQPEIGGGYFPIKRIIVEKVKVTADIFTDGHDLVRAALLFRKQGKEKWQFSPKNFR